MSLRILACNSHGPLAEAIGCWLDVALVRASIDHFEDGETQVVIEENVRGDDIFVIQSTSTPANDYLMELLIVIDALRRSSARSINAVIPYFGYARQDRKVQPRSPITAKLIANLLTAAGVSRVLTIDLHAGQIQGFFDIPLDNLTSIPLFEIDIQQRFEKETLMIVSPDIGAVRHAGSIASHLGVSLAIVDKRREEPGRSHVRNIIGHVAGKDCILIDDMIGGGGTLCNAAEELYKSSARRIFAYCTHGVLSGRAIERINRSPIEELVITDSIYQGPRREYQEKIRLISIAPLLAEGIKSIQDGKSVSDLFNPDKLRSILKLSPVQAYADVKTS